MQQTAMEGRGVRKTSLISRTQPLNNSHSLQQDQAQKMVDLKKAYADVILNTSKEAATRVMASEQRALRFQHELAAAKDEALRMLLRLKQMIDAKTAEAEMTSLNQERKIQELEAQLNEAEDVITDLRAELKQVWLELEKSKNSQVQSLDGQSIKQVASFEESAKPETLVSSPNQELECVTNCDLKNKSLTVNILDDQYCDSTKETEQISNLEDYFAHDSDFASIIMRSKEPELCKNACTQRIRALEGNLLDRKLLTQNVKNQDFGIKNGLIVKVSNGQVAEFRAPKKMEIKKHVKCHQKPKWKRRRRNVRMESSVLECCKPSFVLKQCSSVCDNGKCCEDEYVAKKNAVLPLTDVEAMHGSTGVTDGIEAVNKFELVEKAIGKDIELLNFEGSASHNLTGPSSNLKVEVIDIPSTKTDLEGAEAFEENDGSPGQEDSRLLKHTFQRKRKKESLRNLDEKTDSEKSAAKRRVEEKHSLKNLA